MSKAAEFITEEARRVFPDVVEIRRDIHSHPELSFQELRTSDKAASVLQRLGIEVRRGTAATGVVGLLRGSADGPTIALRADMDALPITEKTGLSCASRVPGVMHACNHDGHVAMLLGAAMVLARLRERLRGNVKFIFQPGEEGYAGARWMIEEGVLQEEPRIDAAFALHLDPISPSGVLLVREGPMMACADVFTLSIIGRGGHGAVPHKSADPIFISGHVITALQGLASRQIDATEPVVISICTIHGGTAVNIIPDSVEMSGTVRSFDSDVRDRLPSMMEEIIRGVTTAFGARYDFNYIRGYPATLNDPQFTQMVRSAAGRILGRKNVRQLGRPRMPSEDFSYFLEKVPGAFAILGARPPEGEPLPPHNAGCVIDEAALEAGVKVHAAVALSYLGEET
jgi:amidohydrolase